jgi:hypothetical protein
MREADRQSRNRAGAIRLPAVLHSQAPRREDPDFQERAGGRAQAGDGALRRSQELDGAPGRPRPRGGAQAPGPRARADDGGGPPVRRDHQSGDGRRDYGVVRGAARPRGPRGARVLRGPRHAGHDAALHRGDATQARDRSANPCGAQLGRRGGPRHRQRPPHGLHRGGPDDAPGRADGAARPARHHPPHRGHAPAGGRLHRGETPRAGASEGAGGTDRRLRDGRDGASPVPVACCRRAGAHPVRRPGGRARATPSRPRTCRGWPRADRGDRRGARRGQVTLGLGSHPLASGSRLARPSGRLRLLRSGDVVSASDRSPQGVLRDRGPGWPASGA